MLSKDSLELNAAFDEAERGGFPEAAGVPARAAAARPASGRAGEGGATVPTRSC